MPYLARLAFRARHYGQRGAALAYMDMLDWALDDLVITQREQAALVELATQTGLGLDDLGSLHAEYLADLVAAAAADGVVTDAELGILFATADALGIDRGAVEMQVDRWRPETGGSTRLEADIRVCFTGSATDGEGAELTRQELSALAAAMGLVPVTGVTKSGKDLLVAADPTSQSGKAAKARRYGIPIVDVQDFLRAEAGQPVPAS